MDGIICLWCGDRGCQICDTSIEQIAINALEDIAELFEHDNEDMKDQAVRGIVAGEYARIALEQIKEVR